MSHAELAVLALLADRAGHGYEVVGRLDAMRAEEWASVADSTVYRALDRLEERGLLEGREEREGNRPRRRVFRITESGRERLRELARLALASEAPATSDRVAGATFAALALPEEERRRALEAGLARLDEDRSRLRAAMDAGASPAAKQLLAFRLAVVDAERRYLLQAPRLLAARREGGTGEALAFPQAEGEGG